MMKETQKRRRRPVIMKKVSTTAPLSDAFLRVNVERENARSAKIPNPTSSKNLQRARYFLRIQITAIQQTVHVPVSVASGRVSTGFVYQVEGTAAGEASARISCRGDGITMVTLGSILYSKIPVGKTAVYTLLFEITNSSEESYRIVVSRINYKLNTNDTRYKRFVTEIGTNSV